MKTITLIAAMALLAGCSEPSADTGTSTSLPPAPLPTAEAETEYPMTGDLAGVDKVRAAARIRVTEGMGESQADLVLTGETVSGLDVGLTQNVTPAQMQELVAGHAVALDGLTSVSYGVPTQQVNQSLTAVQMVGTSNSDISLRLTLGQVISRDDGAPADLGRATQLTVRGSLSIECLVPAGDGSNRTLEDPRHTTDFCRGLTSKYQLAHLTGIR